MAIVAPKGRQHRAADALFRLVRDRVAHLPDDRPGAPDVAFTDALMAACAMCSLPWASFLAFDKERTEGHGATLDGIERVPCDTSMRELLDPVSPEWLRPSFQDGLRQLQRGKALDARTFLDGHSVVALDGTGYFSSKTRHCASWLHTQHRHGSIPA